MTTQVSRREFLVKAASLAGAAAGGAVLAACGATPTPQVLEKVVEQTKVMEKVVTATPPPLVKLTLWKGSWLWDQYFPTIAPSMAYAGITPKVEIDLPAISWDELYQKYWLATEAGVGPDMIYAAPDMLVRALNSNAFLPVPESAIPYSWIEENFLQVSLEQMKIKGKYYLICWEMATMGLCYNKTMLEEVGFDKPPASFEEFLEQAKACVKKQDGQVVRSGFGIHGIKDIYRDILQSMGGEHLTDLFATEIPFNNELGWEAWELLVDFERKHDIFHFKFGKALGSINQTYIQGLSGFGWTTSAVNDEMERNVKGAKGGTISARYCMPKIGPGGYKLGIGPNWGLVVTAACPEEKRDAAWQVYKYCLSKEALLHYISYTNTPPTHKEIAAMGAAAFHGDRAQEYAVELADAVCCGKVFALPPDIPLWDEVHERIYERILGGMSAKDAMAAEMPTLKKCLLVS